MPLYGLNIFMAIWQDKNIFVQSASLNGKDLNQAWFRHADIKNGAVLELKMGKKQSDWGQNIVPPSMSDEN